MPMFEFTMIASGLDAHQPGFEDRFYEAGCDDATISLQKGALILDFSREAASFQEALTNAMRDVAKAGARVARIEPDHLVSLTDIAKRSGLTKAAISNYAAGDRGQSFPAPVSRVTTESPLWDWAIVADWLRANGKVSEETVTRARLVRRLNTAISMEHA